LPLLPGTQKDILAQSKQELPLPLVDHKLKLVQDSYGLYFLENSSDGSSELSFSINGSKDSLVEHQGKAYLPKLNLDRKGKLYYIEWKGHSRLYHLSKNKNGSIRIKAIPLWLSIIPPLLAILLALLFKEVIFSLFTGVFAGAFIAGGMRVSSLFYYIESFFRTVTHYLIQTLADADHLAVIIFSLLIGGMVALISRNGGMAGVVQSLSRYARTAVSTQFMTWLMGVAIFFDDYANTLIVGNTMKKITDKFRISREKLAYIVDSTAAPVAAIAFVTTWIGAELGYIADGIVGLEGFDTSLTPYVIFLNSLKYAYYPVLTLIFILLVVFMQRDFGPMYRAEVRARTTGKVSSAIKGVDDEPDMEDLSPVKGVPLRWYNAVIPVLMIILVTILGLIQTGVENTYEILINLGSQVDLNWSSVWNQLPLIMDDSGGVMVKTGLLIGNADSFSALIWGSLAGMLVAVVMTFSQKLLSLTETVFTMLTGFKTMLPALIILCLAWSLAITTRELHTAEFITGALNGMLNPYLMPGLIFILSALIAFSTGSSWSTMAILFPIAIPASWTLSMAYGLEEAVATEILFNVIRGILGAAVLGDHISPISDTTILSSLASDCNHLDHVRTQMPYALMVGGISLISVSVAAYWGGNFAFNSTLLLIDLAILYLLLRYFGKKLPAHQNVPE
jgi:Na+/H+ antiporter NhaC